ncbi:MAG: calcium/sodium antiporter [Candidatus Ozemobacteraceae bacterium]
MALDLFFIITGLVVLTLAADCLVFGACALARRFGVSPLLIGLTIVAAGTSAPELVVSLQASFENNPGISVGNVIGSNIFNTAAILGIAALIRPITVSRAVIRRDVPVMIVASVLCLFFARDGLYSRSESAFFLVLLVVYTGFSYLQSRNTPDQAPLPQTLPHLVPLTQTGNMSPTLSQPLATVAAVVKIDVPTSQARECGFLLAGLLGMILGSKLLLVGAVSVAKQFGLSDEIIGLTLVAAGTSLPELATSVMAAWKGESEIAIGNVVGSNIFNILGILGIAGVLLPLQVSPHMLSVDILVMVGFAIALVPIMRSGMKVSRFEGALLLLSFLVYNWFLLNH